MNTYDRRALTVAQWSKPRFARELRDALTAADKDLLLRARFRWRVDEFAGVVVRPFVEQVDTWAPSNDLHRLIYGIKPLRVGERKVAERHLVLASRGVGKSAATRIYGYHGLCYGLTHLTAVICKTHTDAVAWSDALRGWVEEPISTAARLYRGLTVKGAAEDLTFSRQGKPQRVISRGFDGALRGLNRRLARPDRVFLDDIESEETSKSEETRTDAVRKMAAKVIPLEPLSGGGLFFWPQTPVHPDGLSARAVRGDPELAAWQVHQFPAVRSWPSSTRWADVRAAFFDLDSHATAEERYEAALDVYEKHEAELEEGAEVLDRARFPILKAQIRRWEIGDEAFEGEYQVNPLASRERLFRMEEVAYHREDGDDLITAGGKRICWLDLPRMVFWDPSDGGGDPGAIGCGAGEYNGRTFVLDLVESPHETYEQARLLIGIAKKRRVREVYVEGNQLPSLLRRTIEGLGEEMGWPVDVHLIHTTENKEARLSSIEPDVRHHLISFPKDLAPVTKRRFDAFNPKKRNNSDDEIDVTQRLHEGLHETSVDVENVKLT